MIRVGIAGWSYADWEGPVYPKPLPRGFDAVSFLGRFVDVLEINSTFYAIPEARHVERWALSSRACPELRFTAKLERGLTHEWSSLDETVRRTRAGALRRALEPLVARGLLRGWLAQFPHSFRAGASERAWIQRLAELFPTPQLVLELRHDSWFEPAVLAEIEARATAIATIDLPQAIDHPPAEWPARGPLGYLRLHGRNSRAWFDSNAHRDQKYDYLYSHAELAPIVQRARRLDQTHGETIVVTNNHFSGKALVNALELLFALKGRPVPAPRALVDAYPRLSSCTVAEGQAGLFTS
jgi:uncharacterized protein YecE (DUF72 family)